MVAKALIAIRQSCWEASSSGYKTAGGRWGAEAVGRADRHFRGGGGFPHFIKWLHNCYRGGPLSSEEGVGGTLSRNKVAMHSVRTDLLRKVPRASCSS